MMSDNCGLFGAAARGDGMRKLFSMVAAAMAASSASSALPQAAPITVSIAAAGTGPKINPDIFGQFAENLGTGIYGGVRDG
jgi:alpha-N-arabinofuranosidase